ncbi:hypothetical protein QVD17_01052 [Tagetes erecta]|uniref:Leucine-rich repeat-containing N-terminal plant-type domain-containing protein n=1 Tax=Tagetes erecta TaxID=13708 RepID=A0AAD8L9X3_TARER|nr:hypothetical protein QVD17_01052 [Tagetes erecta]
MICHKHFLHPAFFFISLALVLVWCKSTTATFVGQQVGDEASDYKCIDKERRALLQFKAGIHQDPKDTLSTWTHEATNDCCKWSGVMCDETGHVTSLYLGYGHLEGEISPSLLNLSYLTNLDLSYNSFNGTIPTFIGSMTQLLSLDLSSNDFTGTIPLELRNLSNLRELSLRSLESCTTESLDWLSHLSQLEVLSMDGISLAEADNWVNVILSLHELSYLSLDGCHLSLVRHPYTYSFVNSSLSSIVTLSLNKNNLNSSMYHWLFPLTSNKLEHLYLSGNTLDGIPVYLGNLCSLTSLYLYNNSIAVKFPDFLKNLSGCTSVTLEELDVSNNQLIGSVSDDIGIFSSLQLLFLSNNKLNGTISEYVWQLPMLNILDASSNSLKGVISESIGKTKILTINLSNNTLEGVSSEVHISNISNVQEIDLSFCKLGPRFPKWIQALKNLTILNIANARISDTIPAEFWNLWSSQLTDLDLSSNDFHGRIPNIPSTLQKLNLSKNKFYGGISFLCQIVDEFLSFLDLSNNLFTGQIPDCLWHFKKLKVLNLGQNKFSGRLSPSVDNLINLNVFYLYNNNFSGELPSSLKYCTNLTFLDLGANKFSGYVPTWIGEKLSGLYALSLTSNNFFGTIPLELCQLVNLQILDLSMNNLYGTIPSCLNNLTVMVQDGFSPHQNEHYFDWGFFFIRFAIGFSIACGALLLNLRGRLSIFT